ncbi:MAG TPA: hypothetical protein VHO90_06345 [Bacteroidales bacterium]|nr:hypothetical protein [Bacteroidales bacterium]
MILIKFRRNDIILSKIYHNVVLTGLQISDRIFFYHNIVPMGLI